MHPADLKIQRIKIHAAVSPFHAGMTVDRWRDTYAQIKLMQF